MKKTYQNYNIKHHFSDNEIKNIAKTLSTDIFELRVLKNNHTIQKKRMEMKISDLAIKINAGYEYKVTRCEKRPNFELGMWEYIIDNKIIEKEKMTSNDYQVKPTCY